MDGDEVRDPVPGGDAQMINLRQLVAEQIDPRRRWPDEPPCRRRRRKHQQRRAEHPAAADAAAAAVLSITGGIGFTSGTSS